MTIPNRIALALAAATLATTGGAAPVFRNPLPVPIPLPGVAYLLTADFDADGHKDLLLVNPGSSVAVLLDDGTGPFAAPLVSPLPYGTGRPAIGDMNADGKLDVVVSGAVSSTVTVMLGDGHGGLTPGPSFGTVGLPGPVAVADFDGDGNLDIAVAGADPHTTANAIAVHFGDGKGHFSGGIATTVEWSADSLVAADMNRDGNVDLVASGYWGVAVLLGNGHGGFAATWRAVDGTGVAVGDFNHDGKPDLAIAAGGSNQWFIEVDLGNGDGTLTRSARYAAGYAAGYIDVADVDGDGNPDLLAAGPPGSTVTVLRGRPDGTFHPPEPFVSGPGAWQIVTGDFDRDGKVDFVTLDYNANNVWAMSFVPGNGDGTFQTCRAFHTGSVVPVLYPGLAVSGGAVADLNRDGKPDVVVIQKHPDANSTDLALMLNDGTGRLAVPLLVDTGMMQWTGNPTFAIGDVNNDGEPDIVVLPSFPLSPTGESFLGDGSGRLSAPISFPVAALGQPTLGHFLGGTNLDLFVPRDSEAWVFPGNGDGTFGAGIQSSVEANNVLVGDLNGDGKSDYISSFVGSVSVCLNDGTGRFTCAPIGGDSGNAAALADFNGDGKLDLLLTTDTGTQTRFGNGEGTFGAPVNFTMIPLPIPPAEAEPVSTADFDGDGKLDVAFGTTVYLGNGDGTFRSRERFRTIGATLTAVADMDGSGSPDLVVTKREADDVDVILTRTAKDPVDSSLLTLGCDVTAPEYGQPVTFTATVTGGAVSLGGAVLFTIDGRPSSLVDVGRDGTAKFTTAFHVGSRAINAAYVGDEYYRPSSASTTLAVARATPTVSVFGYPNPQRLYENVTIYASVSGSVTYNFAQPTGAITLRDGETALTTPVTNGHATIDTLAAGSHLISADYAGDGNFAPASGSYTQVIAGPPTITSIDPADGPVSGGQVVTITGTNLSTATSVTFGQAPAASFVVNGLTSITATTPPHGSAGAVDVVVSTAGGWASLPGGYTYYGPRIRPKLRRSP